MRALRTASAAAAVRVCSIIRSVSENSPSPSFLLMSSMAPRRVSWVLMGAHRMERVWNPVDSSMEWAKFGSTLTSRTMRLVFSVTHCPTTPSFAFRVIPCISTGPTLALQVSCNPLSSRRNREPASALTYLVISSIAFSMVSSMLSVTARWPLILASNSR